MSHTPATGSVVEERSDESFFSPRSTVPSPIPPECSQCDKPSIGAKFLSYVGSSGVGKHAWVAEFLCKDHATDFLPLMSANLNQWKMISKTAKGVYGIRKLTEAEQNEKAVRYHKRMRGIQR